MTKAALRAGNWTWITLTRQAEGSSNDYNGKDAVFNAYINGKLVSTVKLPNVAKQKVPRPARPDMLLRACGARARAPLCPRSVPAFYPPRMPATDALAYAYD
jgi:hypothetical protein